MAVPLICSLVCPSDATAAVATVGTLPATATEAAGGAADAGGAAFVYAAATGVAVTGADDVGCAGAGAEAAAANATPLLLLAALFVVLATWFGFDKGVS